MLAPALACLTAACFGGLSVATYKGISWNSDIRRGAAAMNAVAFVTELALLAGERLSDLGTDVWPFVVAGAVAPGVSQILMLGAVRDIGPARATMLIGASPVLAGVIAIVF